MKKNSPAFRGASLLLGSLFSVALLSACDSNGGAGSAANGANSSVASANGSTSSTGSPSGKSLVTVGESCQGDPNKLCLAMHFVAYKDSSGTPTATQDQAATIIHTLNSIWAQCKIGFQIEKYETVNPSDSGLSYGAASQSQTDQIRRTYDTTNDMLLSVTTGPWGTAVNAWTAMPGQGTYGAIMEQSIVSYGSGIIYAHEFGHYLGLDHVGDTSNLMNAVIYTNSTNLTASQCQTARNAATSYWSAMLRS